MRGVKVDFHGSLQILLLQNPFGGTGRRALAGRVAQEADGRVKVLWKPGEHPFQPLWSMSHLPYPLSHIPCPMSHVPYPISTSHAPHPTSHVPCPVSPVLSPQCWAVAVPCVAMGCTAVPDSTELSSHSWSPNCGTGVL